MISISPLCPHIEQGSGADWLRSLPVRPKAVKVFSSGAARDVKAIDPAITIVLRRWVPDQDSYLHQGADGGRRFVREIPDLQGVDILEGLNECVPSGDPLTVARANVFHLGFAEECAKRGVKPCVLNVAVGNPEVVHDGRPWDGEVRLLVDSVQAAVDAGGFVGYHGYGPARLLYAEDFYAFRDVLRIEPLLRQAGVRGRVRWLHTEAGFDRVSGTSVPSAGWRRLVRDGHLTVQGVCDEYADYARRCRELGVEMAFLFTFWGSPAWRDYEHSDVPEIMNWFQRHWEENTGGTMTNRYRVMPTQGLRVRYTPELLGASNIAGTLPGGSIVSVLEVRGDWAKLALAAGGVTLVPSGAAPDSGYGWCLAEFLEPVGNG